MKCPVCKDAVLLMSEKHGIEIDYCPQCRGIWLDRGELDKIIERAKTERNAYRDHDGYNDHKDYNRYEDKSSYNKPYKKKKGAFLGDILEIFGGEGD